eukprot:1140227-Pelagomonas_calceolata.AAC.4
MYQSNLQKSEGPVLCRLCANAICEPGSSFKKASYSATVLVNLSNNADPLTQTSICLAIQLVAGRYAIQRYRNFLLENTCRALYANLKEAALVQRPACCPWPAALTVHDALNGGMSGLAGPTSGLPPLAGNFNSMMHMGSMGSSKRGQGKSNIRY